MIKVSQPELQSTLGRAHLQKGSITASISVIKSPSPRKLIFVLLALPVQKQTGELRERPQPQRFPKELFFKLPLTLKVHFEFLGEHIAANKHQNVICKQSDCSSTFNANSRH